MYALTLRFYGYKSSNLLYFLQTNKILINKFFIIFFMKKVLPHSLIARFIILIFLFPIMTLCFYIKWVVNNFFK